MSVRIGIDTGGTFTDVVAIDELTGTIISTKTPSTPADPSRGLLEGMRKVLAGQSAGPSGIFHGTTVATNALLQERFTSLGLITTAGFRHVLEIARQSVPSGYGNSYFWIKPDRIVPLHRVQEVPERLNYRGEVLLPFDEHAARLVARRFKQQQINSIAVCFIHAYANPSHELKMQQILAEEHPDASVSLSSEVLPEYREYERAVTTVIDAFVKPSVREYLTRSEAAIHSMSGNGKGAESSLPFLIMQSNGGVLSASDVARQPITTLLSGPAAGVLGASWMASIAGYPNVITVDAGGTSTDICVVDGGAPHITTEGTVGRFPVKVSMIDIITIGTGGGSIAWIDRAGGLRVGPKSAGAAPGPMCYGKGGQEPTVTDANVLLGRLPPHLLGGEVPLDVERARYGLERAGQRLGLDAIRLANGIIEIANWSQVNAIRQVTVKKGLDPRGYTLMAFGGSGPSQVSRVSQLLGTNIALVPPHPGNVSALGLLAVDLKSDYVTTVVQREGSFDIAVLVRVNERLRELAMRDLERQGVDPSRRRYLPSADMRYFGQAYEVRVEMPVEIDDVSLQGAIDRFHTSHERLYGYSYRDTQPVEIVNLRVTGIGVIEKPERAEIPPTSDGRASVPRRRAVHFAEEFAEECAIYDRSELGAGARILGPSIIEEYGSTTVIEPGLSAKVDPSGNLVIGPLTGERSAPGKTHA